MSLEWIKEEAIVPVPVEREQLGLGEKVQVKIPIRVPLSDRRFFIKGTIGENKAGTLGLIDEDETLSTIYGAAGLATSIAGAYHGYKRNHGSVGWGLGWFLFGGLIWPLALPIMLAEGFADPK